jgi:hypothetical protein
MDSVRGGAAADRGCLQLYRDPSGDRVCVEGRGSQGEGVRVRECVRGGQVEDPVVRGPAVRGDTRRSPDVAKEMK